MSVQKVASVRLSPASSIVLSSTDLGTIDPDDELWLVKLDFSDKTGLIVEIRGTTVRTDAFPTGYAQGMHEGKLGAVKTVAATAMSSGGTTTVKLVDSGEEIYPPPAFLKPVAPDQSKQLAVVLHGSLRGQRVQLVTKELDWVVLRPGGTYAEVKEEWMCRVEGS